MVLTLHIAVATVSVFTGVTNRHTHTYNRAAPTIIR